jgi:hypothetical protein
MKSAFGSKRKARKIEVDEDDEGGPNEEQSSLPIGITRKYSGAAATNTADHLKSANEK